MGRRRRGGKEGWKEIYRRRKKKGGRGEEGWMGDRTCKRRKVQKMRKFGRRARKREQEEGRKR